MPGYGYGISDWISSSKIAARGGGIPPVNEDFITKWAVSAAQTITLWSQQGTVSYNYDVDWGDGETETSITASDKTHEYADADTYTVTITGQFGGLKMSRASAADKTALVEFVNWGISEVSGIYGYFKDCANMVYSATDSPDLTNLTATSGNRLYSTFQGCDTITSLDLSGWTDTDNIINFTNAFYHMDSLTTLNLTGWDTSNVTTMVNMCNGTGDDSAGCDFTMPDLDWSACTTFGSAFKNTHIKTIDVTGWTLRAAGVTLASMFYNAEDGSAGPSFSVDATGWTNTSGITSLSNFGRDSEFTSLDVTGWDTSNVTSFALFIYNNLNLTHITGLNGLDASSTTSINQAFLNCKSLNFGSGDTTNFGSNWGPNLGSCTNFASAFSSVGYTTAGTAPPDVSNWDVSAGTTFATMFYRCKWTGGADIDTSAWEISSACTTMASFVRECSTTKVDLSDTNCDLSGTTTKGSFGINSSLTRLIFNATLDKPDFSACTNFASFLQGCTIATGDYDELLLKLDDGGQSGVTLHGGSSEYSAGAAADAHLALEGKFWSITDGGEE